MCCVLVLGTQSRAADVFDDFDDNVIDPALWTASAYGVGPQIAEVNGQLQLVIPATSSGTDFGAKAVTTCRFRGDFDVQVDYRLLTWPVANGVRMGLGIAEEDLGQPHGGLERISFGASDYPGWPRESYLTDFLDGVHGITGTGDVAGALRLVRTGSTQTGYYYGASGWVALHTGTAPTTDVALRIGAWSAYQFTHCDVAAAFDNVLVNRGEMIWPPVPVRANSWGAVKALYR